jgi:hypothetical protein
MAVGSVLRWKNHYGSTDNQKPNVAVTTTTKDHSAFTALTYYLFVPS